LRTERALAIAAVGLAVWLGVAPSRAADAGSVLLPGIDIRTIDFEVGAWCRYIVVDEAMDVVDSSAVYIAVVGRERTSGGTAYWLEIENGKVSAGPEDRDLARALVDDDVKRMADGDSLYRYVSRYYIRRGRGPVEPGDVHDLKRLTIISPTSDRDWVVTPRATISTPAGKLSCESRRFEKTESNETPSGRVKIVQRRTDRVEVWTSDAIPVFHLARCVVERERESKTIPAVRGIPQSGPRRSRTTSVVVAFGKGAKSLVSSP
jgi:hypothetical protein